MGFRHNLFRTVENTAEHAGLNVFRRLTLSGVNDGCKRLVTEFRQRFALSVLLVYREEAEINERDVTSLCHSVHRKAHKHPVADALGLLV